MDSIYREIILDHYRNPKNYGRLKNPTKSAVLHNQLCGDKIRIDIVIKSGLIKEIKFSGKGCAISQASASMLTEYVKNKKMITLGRINKSIVLKKLGIIKLSPNRLHCALLPLEVLRKLIFPKIRK